ncbi:hypothetical protein MHYP_G00106240 [Metynnis hypsauchen]
MSCVKEECEDVSVMEASGLKTEDEEMKEEPLFQDTEEECKPDVKSFPEEYSAQVQRWYGPEAKLLLHAPRSRGEEVRLWKCGEINEAESSEQRTAD